MAQTLPDDRLRVAYRDGAVRAGCVCGAEAIILADDVDVLMRKVKAFIGAHGACVSPAVPAQREGPGT